MGEVHEHRPALKRGKARQRTLRAVQAERTERQRSSTSSKDTSSKDTSSKDASSKRDDDEHEVAKAHVGRLRETKEQSGNIFRRFAQAISTAAGKPWTFMAAVLLIVVWGVSGPIFKFSDTWQLVINTGTTIITFLMVFLIQNTQNRDTEALRLKLDELVLATRNARNEFVKIEDLDDEDLERLEQDLKDGCQTGGSDDDSEDER